ncbi:MAG: glucose-6-phosphate dehydrogenase [Planctomycetota bacterium]
MPPSTSSNMPDPCVMVLFGASGDLAARKLIPALYELDCDGRLPEEFCVIGISRTEMTDEEWRTSLRPWVEEHARDFNDEHWLWFSGRLHYLAGSATDADLYPVLIRRISEVATEHKLIGPEDVETASPWAGQPNVLFYLAVAPSLVEPIVERIGQSGMVYEGARWCALDSRNVPWQRIIVEKPIGTDRDSARALNQAIGRVFDEETVYRIDHYLGKELVQNILVMRFANSIFEPLWNNQYVEYVQVSATEQVGVGRRAANYYDQAGATRDMIQSHLLQVLALIAMEPPPTYDATAIRREKIKLLDSARRLTQDEAHQHAAFGRYAASDDPEDEDGGRGYADLPGVASDRCTETFSALRLYFDNWRWAGVPFYVRSGKKLDRKLTEVVVQFRRPPAHLFRSVEPFRSGGIRPANRIVINIAPDEGIGLRFEAKVPGPTLRIESVKADFDYGFVFESAPLEAYGPLMLDAMRGDQTLFKHRDEVDHAWRIVDPFVHCETIRRSIESYAPYSWGPASADALLAEAGHTWHNPRGAEKR